MSFAPKLCPHIDCPFNKNPGGDFRKKGFFHIRRSNNKIRRFFCKHCRRSFSSRSFKPDYRHKKPDLNAPLRKLLCSGVSLRAASKILGLTYKNTYLKFLWLSSQAQLAKAQLTFNAKSLYFDEMETIHHTKCKPLSIGLIVNDEYLILDAQVAEMPAKGRLAAFSVQKYGIRKDCREAMLQTLFKETHSKLRVSPLEIFSDAKSSYRKFVQEFFPSSKYETYSRVNADRHRDRLHEKSQKKRFDPLFPVNQRCAKLRSDIKRLVRRSWCTTKKPENLQRHLDLYIVNQLLSS